MRRRPTLIAFAKEPRMGRVKSRLARDIGKVAAWQFYRATLTALLRRLGRDPRWRCRLAVTPDRSARRHPWPARWQTIPQGRGELGQRMLRALHSGPPGPVLLIGSDIPDIARRHIIGAARLLNRYDSVLGPAADGGYWLIGLRHGDLARQLNLAAVRWSSPHALADTLAVLTLRGLTCARAVQLDDIDSGLDFRQWRTRQAAGKARARAIID